MKRRMEKGFTLVEIMIVVAIIALLAAIAIPNLLRARISANDSLAKSTLRAISTAAESFATASDGNYPDAVTDLTEADPPYLNEDYCDGVSRAGFSYDCDLTSSGYTVTATVDVAGTTGTTNYTIETGGVLGP